jgi:hypothetical protein
LIQGDFEAKENDALFDWIGAMAYSKAIPWMPKKTKAGTIFLLHFVEKLCADFITFPIKNLLTILAPSSHRPEDKWITLRPYTCQRFRIAQSV